MEEIYTPGRHVRLTIHELEAMQKALGMVLSSFEYTGSGLNYRVNRQDFQTNIMNGCEIVALREGWSKVVLTAESVRLNLEREERLAKLGRKVEGRAV